jgi:hypothetical protein
LKVIANHVGRVVILKPTDEITPSGGIAPNDIRSLIAERYGFTYVTSQSAPLEQIQKEGFKFQMGKLHISNQTFVIEELSIFNDGIVVSAKTTDAAEAFVSNLIQWAKDSHGFRIDETFWQKKLFLSEMTVQFDRQISGIIANFDQVSKVIGGVYGSTYDLSTPFNVATLLFDYDRASVPPLAGTVSAFKIERRIGEPFSANKFYCTAALRTQDHVTALEAFEQLIAD